MKQTTKRATATGTPKATRRKSHAKIHYQIANALDTVKETEDNREALTALCDTLALWARYMMELDPTVAASIYRVCGEALRENRATLYNFPYLPHDERERAATLFHCRVVWNYQDIFGIENPFRAWPSWQSERAAVLLKMQSQLAEMASRVGATTQITNARDLASLRAQLSQLESLPENESVRFQLETEIARLEEAATGDEWPDVIGD